MRSACGMGEYKRHHIDFDVITTIWFHSIDFINQYCVMIHDQLLKCSSSRMHKINIKCILNIDSIWNWNVLWTHCLASYCSQSHSSIASNCCCCFPFKSFKYFNWKTVFLLASKHVPPKNVVCFNQRVRGQFCDSKWQRFWLLQRFHWTYFPFDYRNAAAVGSLFIYSQASIRGSWTSGKILWGCNSNSVASNSSSPAPPNQCRLTFHSFLDTCAICSTKMNNHLHASHTKPINNACATLPWFCLFLHFPKP